MSTPSPNTDSTSQNLRWYEGISRYQWLVLLIASLGWVFDIFEGQIFVASMRDAMPALLGVTADNPSVSRWNDLGFGSFLLGGAFGGVLFGMLSDRIGRSKTMILTILFYSMFTCLTAFAQSAWQMVLLRFFVAMGVGGEWAVASAMVAEVMPQRSRAVMSSIFHASSVFGTLLAAAAGAFIVTLGESAWRWGFAIGALPALLTLWIRWSLHEPEQWVKARQRASEDATQKTGRLSELFHGQNLRNTLVGVSLASIGLVTFWGAHIYGKNALLRHAQATAIVEEGLDPATADKEQKQMAFAAHKTAIKQSEMLSMVLNTIGGGLGLVLFGAISNRLGRKGAFALYHIVAFIMVVWLFKFLIPQGASATVLAFVLPVFGFFTLGMHAGYAVYFPELYPTRLRGTGAGFCFNMGRLATAIAFFGFGATTITDENKALMLAPLYLVGVGILFFAKETRGTELME
ncbi:putative sialic acid transporter [Thalassoglobus neptunius]|uniref:Putative sialic acid transporter n=1 Tax=Thalassoglobus neptunius TaxID=1938619 RepID=A0A5C5VNX4_9PLAN|nr:MFS transporter [Thalassoglobus neptunius]TWT39817.1 putative sialic acid transporter [Thalassoglobus neptunius]